MRRCQLILTVMVVVLLTSACIGETTTPESVEPIVTQAPVETTIAPQTTPPPTTSSPVITTPPPTTSSPVITTPPPTEAPTPSPTTVPPTTVPPTEAPKIAITVDGDISDWDILGGALINDKIGEDKTIKNVGTDIKSLYTSCNDDSLAFALELNGALDPSKFRNYFIGVDFDGDYKDEYNFGFRPSGYVWLFDHTVNKDNWDSEPAEIEIATSYSNGIIEGKIPRKKYGIPNKVNVFARVTEGGPNVDSTRWATVKCLKDLEIDKISYSNVIPITVDGDLSDWNNKGLVEVYDPVNDTLPGYRINGSLEISEHGKWAFVKNLEGMMESLDVVGFKAFCDEKYLNFAIIMNKNFEYRDYGDYKYEAWKIMYRRFVLTAEDTLFFLNEEFLMNVPEDIMKNEDSKEGLWRGGNAIKTGDNSIKLKTLQKFCYPKWTTTSKDCGYAEGLEFEVNDNVIEGRVYMKNYHFSKNFDVKIWTDYGMGGRDIFDQVGSVKVGCEN